MGDELEELLQGKTLNDIMRTVPISHPIYVEIDDLRRQLEEAQAEVERLKQDVRCQGLIIQNATEGWVPEMLYKAVEAKLSRYEGAVEVEGIIYSNNYVPSIFGEPYNRIELLRVPNMPDIVQGQRVKVLVMKEDVNGQ